MPGAGEDDIDAAELGDRGVDGCLNLGLIGHIRR
ncbi:unannotated protein [freshwater metagenome]|uniref:Unannotated protein n=1 Tax=freshwater metagenome TaxID=449393 RepID=A0A6J7P223_9ZZZZ